MNKFISFDLNSVILTFKELLECDKSIYLEAALLHINVHRLPLIVHLFCLLHCDV